MTAIFELVQITVGLATTAEMIATEHIKGQIKSFIDQHKDELQILRDIQSLLDTTFKNSILNNQLGQFNLISSKLFKQIADNMIELTDLTNQITAKYKDISPAPYTTSTKEYAINAIVGVFTCYVTTNFLKEQFQTKFGGLKNPIQSMGTALQKAILKQRSMRKGIIQGQQGTEMVDLAEELPIQQPPIPQKITLKEIWDNGLTYVKQNKLKSLGNGLLGALRVLMVATGIFMFVQGIYSLEQMSKDYDDLKKELGTGGTIQKDQLSLMQVVSLIAADASNILYDTYNLILDLRNSIQLLLINLPQLHEQLNEMAQQLTAENYLPGFNFSYLQSVSKLSGQLFNIYSDGQKSYNKRKSSDPQGARNELISNLYKIKNTLQSLEPTDLQIQNKTSKFPIAYSKTIKGLAEKLNAKSQIISLALYYQSGKLTKYQEFLTNIVQLFNDRKSQNQDDLKDEQDAEYLRFIVGHYITSFINPNLSLENHIPTDYINKKNMNAALDRAQTIDPFIKDNIARFVTSFTIKFYGDDKEGLSVFGKVLKDLKGLPSETMEHLMSEVNQTPNFIAFPDQYSGQVEDPNAEKNGNLLSIKQLTTILEKIQPDMIPEKKRYEIVWKKRGKLMNQVVKTIGIVKFNTQTKNTYIQDKEFTKTVFTRALLLRAMDKVTSKTSFYSIQDLSQDPRSPDWKFIELGTIPSPEKK